VAGMVKEEVGTCIHKEEEGTEMEEGETYKRTEVVGNVLEAGENYKRMEVVKNVLEAGETCTRIEVVGNVLEAGENYKRMEVVKNVLEAGETCTRIEVVGNVLDEAENCKHTEVMENVLEAGKTCTPMEVVGNVLEEVEHCKHMKVTMDEGNDGVEVSCVNAQLLIPLCNPIAVEWGVTPIDECGFRTSHDQSKGNSNQSEGQWKQRTIPNDVFDSGSSSILSFDLFCVARTEQSYPLERRKKGIKDMRAYSRHGEVEDCDVAFEENAKGGRSSNSLVHY
nr:hypothetical protein [Tanacetum cinerariifolium]